MPSEVKTKFLVISDTHGKQFLNRTIPQQSVDVVIHCGDLTQHSKLDEFRETLEMIRQLKAPLKLIIAGNHDFSLDSSAFRSKVEEANKIGPEPLDKILIESEFGKSGEARKLLEYAKKDNIVFLDEGTHQFALSNGANLKVFASPYTPSNEVWGFSYSDEDTHEFNIVPKTDVVITHGPPRGIMDMSADKKRIGCSQLFTAVARAQPRMHCFGHVHSGWGAKLAAWRPKISDTPSHFSDIDNDRSLVIDNLSSLGGTKHESEEDKKQRENKLAHCKKERCYTISHHHGDVSTAELGCTLFVNAAIEAEGKLAQFPWVIDIDLPTGTMSDDAEGVKDDQTVVAAIDGTVPLGTEKEGKEGLV